MKKILSIVMVITMLFVSAFSSYANAQQKDIAFESNTKVVDLVNEKIHNYLTALKENPDYLGFTSEELENAYIGAQFKITNIESTVLTDEIIYYPIISNGNIIGIFSIIYDGNEALVSLGKEFSSDLNEVLSLNNETVALYSNKSGVFAINKNNNLSVISSSGVATYKSLNSTFSFNDVSKQYNVISKKDLLEKNETIKYTEPLNMQRAISTTKYLPNYPGIAQTVNGVQMDICWAAVIASIIRYETPAWWGSYTAQNVCDKLGHSYTVENVRNIPSHLSYFLGGVYKPAYVDRSFTTNEVITIINNNDPAYISGSNPSGGVGHAVALCGYQTFPTGFTARIMNSANSSNHFSTCDMSTANPKFISGNIVYTWTESVRLLY